MTNIIDAINAVLGEIDDTEVDLFQVFKIAEGNQRVVYKWIETRTDKSILKMDVRGAARRWRVWKALGREVDVSKASEFVRAVVEKEGFTIKYNGLVKRRRNQNLAFVRNTTFDHIMRAVIRYNGDCEAGLTENFLKNALEEWQDDEKTAIYSKVGTDIGAGIPETEPDRCEADWLALADAIRSPNRGSAEYVVAALQTLIWQVKRKMLADPDYRVYKHIMPVIIGETGKGKSYFLANLFLAPVREVRAQVSFKSSMDERNLEIWDYPVQVYDEMEYASKASIDTIKNRITAEEISARKLYTNGQATIEQRSTMIGTSEKDLQEILYDPLGMRRYAPIYIKEFPHEIVNKIDYLALWRSVRVDDPRPLDAIPIELAAIQEAERAVSPIEYFLRDYLPPLIATGVIVGQSIAANVLHTHYMDMMRAHYPKATPTNPTMFGKAIKKFFGKDWCPIQSKTRNSAGVIYLFRQKAKTTGMADAILSLIQA